MEALRRVLIIILVPLGFWFVGSVLLDDGAFTAPRLAGTPLVAQEGTPPSVLLLTTHRETLALLPSLLDSGPRDRVHVDLWAFSAMDFTPLWVRRVGSAAFDPGGVDAAITGARDGTIWLTAAGRIHAFALGNGAPLHSASPEPAGLRQPMELVRDGDHLLRVRGALIGASWVGFVREEEIPTLTRDPGMRLDPTKQYQLWIAKVSEQQDPLFPRTIREYRDFRAGAFLLTYTHSGLLTEAVEGRREPIFLGSPIQLAVLHDVSQDGLTRRGLLCMRLSGNSCWHANLGLTQVLGVATLRGATPAAGALFLHGLVQRPEERPDEAAQAVIRVAFSNGRMRVINVGDIDPRALKAELTK